MINLDWKRDIYSVDGIINRMCFVDSISFLELRPRFGGVILYPL